MRKLREIIANGKIRRQRAIFVMITVLVLCVGGVLTFLYTQSKDVKKEVVKIQEKKQTKTSDKDEQENKNENTLLAEDGVEDVQEENEEAVQTNNASTNTVSTDKNTSSSSTNNNQTPAPNTHPSKPQEDTSTSEEEIVKGPKPAKYSVVRAYDFPNDFPNDGWHWHYSTYVWTPQHVYWAWDEDRGYYVGDIVWVVALRSTTSNTDISLAPETIENVKKLMVPAPTLEESQELVKKDDDFFYIRYGAINVYVCMEE